MRSHANWRSAGRVIPFKPRACTNSPVEDDLAQIDRARREIEFCELAEAMALSRITALRGALSGCRAELQDDTQDAEDLRHAADTIAEELASFEQTLPLECAFRADQRDLAVARMTEAQERLRKHLSRNFVHGETEMVARVHTALSLSPGAVVYESRQQAATRMVQIY